VTVRLLEIAEIELDEAGRWYGSAADRIAFPKRGTH